MVLAYKNFKNEECCFIRNVQRRYFAWRFTLIIVIASSITCIAANNLNASPVYDDDVKTANCVELDYKKQLCNITKPSDWNCLKAKSLSMSEDSCPETRLLKDNPGINLCKYVEICAFADEDFLCDGSYECTVITDGMINCTKDQHNFLTKNCTPSLIYCPQPTSSEEVNDCVDEEKQARTFQDECIQHYEQNSAAHQLWYYVSITHYNNKSENHSLLLQTHHANWTGNVTKLCPTIMTSTDSTPTDQSIATTATGIAVGVTLLLAITYVAFELKRKMKKEVEKSRKTVERQSADILKRVDGESSFDIVEETLPGDVCDEISAMDECCDVPPSQPETTENHHAGVDLISSPLVGNSANLPQTEHCPYISNPTYMRKTQDEIEIGNSIIYSPYCDKNLTGHLPQDKDIQDSDSSSFFNHMQDPSENQDPSLSSPAELDVELPAEFDCLSYSDVKAYAPYISKGV